MEDIMKQLKKIAALILITAALLSAQPFGGMGGRGFSRITEELNLTAEQEKKFDELHVKFEKNAIDQQADIRKKMLDEKTAMQNEDFTSAKKIVSELFALKEDAAKQRITNHEEMLKLLTPEQKEKFKALQKERHNRGGMHKKGNRGGKHGNYGSGKQMKMHENMNMETEK